MASLIAARPVGVAVMRAERCPETASVSKIKMRRKPSRERRVFSIEGNLEGCPARPPLGHPLSATGTKPAAGANSHRPTPRPRLHATAPCPAFPPRPSRIALMAFLPKTSPLGRFCLRHSAKLVAAGRPDARGMSGSMGEVLVPGIRLWRQKRWIARTSRAMTAVGMSYPSTASPPGSTGWSILTFHHRWTAEWSVCAAPAQDRPRPSPG